MITLDKYESVLFNIGKHRYDLAGDNIADGMKQIQHFMIWRGALPADYEVKPHDIIYVLDSMNEKLGIKLKDNDLGKVLLGSWIHPAQKTTAFERWVMWCLGEYSVYQVRSGHNEGDKFVVDELYVDYDINIDECPGLVLGKKF